LAGTRFYRSFWGTPNGEISSKSLKRPKLLAPIQVTRSRTILLTSAKWSTSYRQPGPNLPQPASDFGEPILPHLAAEIPWFHNVILIEKVKQPAQRLWYAAKTIEHGWSRAVLTVQIESDLHKRQGSAVSNFAATLPAPQSDLAQQALKDPYLFDFLTLREEDVERDLENGLVDQIQKFLLELGAGFAFVGRRVNLVVGDDDFYLDLLFYHLKLRCFVVIDLKMKAFTPEDAGKMNFYLSAVDSLMRHPDDAPTIGLILCKTHNRLIAEYALRELAALVSHSTAFHRLLARSMPDWERRKARLEEFVL
jgi:predicted nuclease of restriction endonuclease-like (RecB) superfamily